MRKSSRARGFAGLFLGSGSVVACYASPINGSSLSSPAGTRRPASRCDAQGHKPDFALSITAAKSGAIGIFLNGLTLAPPVFPCGTNPNAVLVAAPAIRKSWPRTSSPKWLRTAHSNISTWIFTCQYVDSWPITCARSRWRNSICASPADRACSAHSSSESTWGATRAEKPPSILISDKRVWHLGSSAFEAITVFWMTKCPMRQTSGAMRYQHFQSPRLEALSVYAQRQPSVCNGVKP